MLLSSDLRIIKDGEKKPEGRVVLRLRRASPRAEADAEPEAAEADGTDRAAEAAAQAEDERNAILAAARMQADEIRGAARRDGYREGYEEAKREAERAGREIRARAQSVLQQAEQVRARTLEELEPQVLELAMDIAKRLVAEQLTLAPETITAVVRSALARVRDRERFVVYAHPEDAAILEARPDEWRRQVAPEAVVRIIADEEVEAGGCRVETELGEVDATLESRWREMVKALNGG